MKDFDYDFSECEFIDEEMKFYTYNDFIQNCYAIKRLYNKYLSNNGKLFYMWYLYSNIHLTMHQKNKAWDYINGYIEKESLYDLLKSKYI